MAIYRGTTKLAENNPKTVSDGEITAGNEIGLRSWSPAAVKELVDEHGGAPAGLNNPGEMLLDYEPATADTTTANQFLELPAAAAFSRALMAADNDRCLLYTSPSPRD